MLSGIASPPRISCFRVSINGRQAGVEHPTAFPEPLELDDEDVLAGFHVEGDDELIPAQALFVGDVAERLAVEPQLSLATCSEMKQLRLARGGLDRGRCVDNIADLALTVGSQVDDGKPVPFYPLGTDRMGRDMWSRLMHATRISMSIGLVGVFLSLFLGVLLGGISGYKGGKIDVLIQRLIEQIRSMPTIPLWLALAAAVPQDWSMIKTYFAITIILSLAGWTRLAREVRGRFLAMREEDFVIAARLSGTSELAIIFRHMVPSFVSHIIAVTTLAIPAIIIAETSLSFLGLGMRQPAISWGVLLQEAQNIQSVALAPWLLMPGVFVIIAVLAYNFMGDGMRDAADPYALVQRR